MTFMRLVLSLLVFSVLTLQASEQKPHAVAVRLHAEGSTQDSPTFVTPVALTVPAKNTVIRKIPVVTEKDFVAFYPFSASDGTIGSYFLMDAHGTKKLEQHTTEFRDTLIVVSINGRVSCAVTVGKKITDGIITVPTGFLPKEIAQLQTTLPTIGKEKEFPEQKKKALAILKENRKKEALEAKANKAAKASPTPKP